VLACSRGGSDYQEAMLALSARMCAPCPRPLARTRLRDHWPGREVCRRRWAVHPL